jgi:hypothetical protein
MSMTFQEAAMIAIKGDHAPVTYYLAAEVLRRDGEGECAEAYAQLAEMKAAEIREIAVCPDCGRMIRHRQARQQKVGDRWVDASHSYTCDCGWSKPGLTVEQMTREIRRLIGNARQVISPLELAEMINLELKKWR